MPDISMRQLSEEEIKDLRDVCLADALKKARHRLKVKYDKLRDDTNAKFDEHLAAIRTSSAPTSRRHYIAIYENYRTSPRCALRLADKQTGISP